MSAVTELWCEPCLFIKLEKVKADVLCEDCLERYCEQCALDHAKFRVFRNHQISQLSSDEQYENVEYLVPVNVSVGHQGTDVSQTTYCDGHTYKNIKQTGSSSDMEPEVFREPGPSKDSTSSQRDSNNSFKVKVTETDLIKRIPGVDRDEIEGSIFLFTVEKTKISLFLKNKYVFTCALNSIRRFGKKETKVMIEVGRRCELGPGELCLISDQAMAIHSALGQMLSTRNPKIQ